MSSKKTVFLLIIWYFDPQGGLVRLIFLNLSRRKKRTKPIKVLQGKATGFNDFRHFLLGTNLI